MSRRFVVLASALCAAGLHISHASAQVITTPPPQPAPRMVCEGGIAQQENMNWDSRRLEFSFPYARQQQYVTLKASVAQLNASLLVDSDEAFMRGRETKARVISPDDRSIAISELKISRSTGAFTMVVLLFRNVDVLEGRTLWEGSCKLQGSSERKF